MPHVNSGGGDDLASTDEVKVYKDEGEEESEKRSSENLSEEKLGLVTESEEGKSSEIQTDDKRNGPGSEGKPSDPGGVDRLPLGYPVIPYPFPNGASLPGALGSKVLQPHPLTSLYMYNNEHFSSPPPAHMGIPPVHIDSKTGLPRPMYLPPHPSQFHHPLYGPADLSQVQWNSPTYPITTAGLRGPYHTSLSSSSLARFSPPGLLHPHPGMPSFPGIPHPAIVTPGPKQEILDHPRQHPHFGALAPPDLLNHNEGPPSPPVKKKPHIKKPLNAFMLFMKEMRAQVIEECALKESAAINQILGRRWHGLDRAEQAKYYDMARKEKELHMQLYPGWSARDNYGAVTKKSKKRKRDPSQSSQGENNKVGCVDYASDDANAKKCRARFGVESQTQWCKPCRRKKKCIRFMEDGEMCSNTDGEDNASSIAAIDSTTDGDSELGSPMPSSTPDCHPGIPSHSHHHHPLVSHSIQGLTRTTADIMDMQSSNNNNNNNSSSSGGGAPPRSLAAGPIGSVVSSSMVLAT